MDIAELSHKLSHTSIVDYTSMDNTDCLKSDMKTEYVITYYDGTDKKLYEGPVVHGHAEGLGKSYHENGQIKVEGDWSIGLPNGYIRQYREDGSLIYEGEVLDGEAHGQGTVFDHQGLPTYIGRFHYGKFHGQGTLFQEGKPKFEGTFSCGLFLTGTYHLYDYAGNHSTCRFNRTDFKE